jgi:hypothetical protein
MLFFCLLILFSPLGLSASQKVTLSNKRFGSPGYLLNRQIGIKQKKTSPQDELCDLILYCYENNIVDQFEHLLDQRSNSFGIGLAVNEKFKKPVIIEAEDEDGMINIFRAYSFGDLLKFEKSLHFVFAKHRGSCKPVKKLFNALMERARGFDKKVSVVGFIDRLGVLYRETKTAAEESEYFELYELLLDFTLGNDVEPERFNIFSDLNLEKSKTFIEKVIGHYHPTNERLTDLSDQEREKYFSLLEFARSEIQFAFNFLPSLSKDKGFLEISKDNMPTIDDVFMSNVISEMEAKKSILQPFIEHGKEVPYERLITLLEYCSQKFMTGYMEKFRADQCIFFLENAPNIPVPSLHLIFGYFIHNVQRHPKEAVELITMLSDEQRNGLSQLQPKSLADSGISDPDCKDSTEIRVSLLKIGADEPFDGIFALAEFSLDYLDNPQNSDQFLTDLKDEAEENELIEDVLDYKVAGPNSSSIKCLEYLENCPEDESLFALISVSFNDYQSEFKFYLRELVWIFLYPPEIDLPLFGEAFQTSASFKQFLIDLKTAKNGGKIGFNNIWPFFPWHEETFFKKHLSHKEDFGRWIRGFGNLFREYIINEKKKIPK